jgi:DNA-binding response OmpR family regulator
MNTPIVVISGMSDEVYKTSISKEGVDAYLTKPYDFEELNTIIQNILSHKKA